MWPTIKHLSKKSHIKVWFTEQNSVPLEVENKINLILVINNKIT